MFKNKIIKWAIKQIIKDGSGSYGDMRYLEDVLENEWGEKMFIFSHRLVPINKVKLDAANAKARQQARNDPDAPQMMDTSKSRPANQLDKEIKASRLDAEGGDDE
jgi:hypothetical protein